MKLERLVVLTLALAALAGLVAAQNEEYRPVENPFQDEFDYRVGSDLQPGVEIDGVRWVRFAVYPKEGEEIIADQDVPVTMELDFVNRRADSAKIQAIVLFETVSGLPLERVEFKPVRIGGDRPKESTQKFKLPGNVLLGTGKVYLFCEVER